MTDLLDRLGRRGTLTITVKDGVYDVRLKTPGPYGGRSWCTTDEADFWGHLHLGARDWHGDGRDLDALLATCDEESRPRWRTVDDLVWGVTYRRRTRTLGPPLPSYRRWAGWRPGMERWLRTSSHAHEYLVGYERDLMEERRFLAEQAEYADRTTARSSASRTGARQGRPSVSLALAALIGFTVGYAVRAELHRRADRRVVSLINRQHEERLKAIRELGPAAPGRPRPRTITPRHPPRSHL